MDVRALAGEAQISAMRKLLRKAQAKSCHVCKKPGALLKCGNDRCRAWLHVPCIQHYTRSNSAATDGDGQLQVVPWCGEHEAEYAVAQAAAEQAARDAAAAHAHRVGVDDEAKQAGQADEPSASPSSGASSSAVELSASGASCEQLLQDFVALLSDVPAGHLDLSYMQTMVGGLLERLRGLLDGGVVAVVVGNNGVGKTWIINLLLFLTVNQNLQYQKDAAGVHRPRAFSDRAAAELYSGFTRALQTGTGSSAASATAASLSRLPSSLLPSLTGDLQRDPFYTDQELHRLSDPLTSVDGDAAGGAAAEFLCLSLNDWGNTELSKKEFQRQLSAKWEKPLKEACDRALAQDEIRPWLLRSADEGTSTTAHICRLLYSPLWHATVHFMTAELAQEASYNYVSRMVERFSQLPGGGSSASDAEIRLAKAQYDQLVGRPLADFDWSECEELTPQQVERMTQHDDALTDRSLSGQYEAPRSSGSAVRKPRFPSDREPIPLLADIEPLLGRTLLFRGAGKDVTADREFLRRQLFYWSCRHPARHAILFCSVYAPCRVLEGLELWDTPGMEDEDPVHKWLLQEALARADITVCVMPRASQSNHTVIAELIKAKVLERSVLERDHVGHVAFLHYVERRRRTRCLSSSRTCRLVPRRRTAATMTTATTTATVTIPTTARARTRRAPRTSPASTTLSRSTAPYVCRPCPRRPSPPSVTTSSDTRAREC